MIFNRLDKPDNERLIDLTPRELAVLLPLLVGIVWLGLYPGPVLRRMEPASRRFVDSVQPAITKTARAGGTVPVEVVWR